MNGSLNLIWAAHIRKKSDAMLEKAILRQAEFIEQLNYEAIDEKVRNNEKRILLDSIGCMAAGSKQLKKGRLAKGKHLVIGDSVRREKMSAVFVNASAMVKNELDEGNQFAFGHPACHILPALFAEAEEKKVTPEEFLTAFLAAYETAARWGAAVRLHKNMHVHGTMQTMGAAAAVCKLHHCSKKEIFESIVLANSLPQSTTWKAAFHGDQIRNGYVGVSNLIGMHAFLMTKTGVKSSIETLQSVWNEIVGDGIREEFLTENLGNDYWCGKNYFKMHSACRYVHAFADMVKELKKTGLKNEDITRIELYTYKQAAMISQKEAENAFAAKFSIPVSVAMMFENGSLALEHTTDKDAQAARVKLLAKKIEVKEDKEYTKMLPEVRANRMAVYTTNQGCYELKCQSVKGDYSNPFSSEELERKFERLTDGIWTPERQKQIIRTISHLEECKNMEELFKLLAGRKRGK